MNSKKDEPGKDAAGPAGPGSSRPHATLDLKATELEPKPDKDETASASPKASDTGAARALPGASPRGPAGAAKAEPRQAAKGAPARPNGYGGFFTHLAAGVAGGIVALLAADMLASQLGLIGPAQPVDTSAALEHRIAELEADLKQKSDAPQLGARLTAAEAKLKPLGGSVDHLAQKQDELARDLKAIDAKVGTQGDAANTESRLAKLEEQLTAMSAAAERDPQSGRLPQLAAITGKIADLESTMATQLDALRKNVSKEIDTRLTAATEASETAKSGTQRIDREFADMKTETARLAAGLDALKAESEQTSTTLKTTADTLVKLQTEIDTRLAAFAKPADISAAVSPLSAKLKDLKENVQGVIESENARKATAKRIVLSLELANLQRAIDRGTGYAPELAQARKLADGSIDLTPLARFADTGVPTPAELRHDFKAVAFKIIDAGQGPAEGSIVDRLLAGAKSVVRVRKVSHSPDDKSVEAMVARMETALNEDRLGDVLQEARTLPQASQDAAQDFLAKVEARHAVDHALTSVEAQLKASLVAPAGAGDKAQE